ncbi:hypothetical protein BV22DRAFT_1035880 [Leucogyrophana mollusca]|uniref:Uncharacterized protein n=1 Tax=Leucogyrophana mollusca TaxID=85980 RepID=A0ACB8BF02_9AGAM|nr:hypothetical protein BV22DRAFT_1035880 [Leucogyrophana mollusca]
MAKFDRALMNDLNRLFEPTTKDISVDAPSQSSQPKELQYFQTRYDRMKAQIPPREATDSPCSSSATLLNDDDLQSADAYEPPKLDEYLAANQPMKSKFNPNATPFVPSGLNPLTLAPPPNLEPEWLRAFRTGTSSGEFGKQEHFAAVLVQSTRWSFGAICDLADHFCRNAASDRSTETPTPAAQFARAVYTALRNILGEWESSCFAFQLRQRVLGLFRACWSSDQPLALSLRNPASIDYLYSAYSIACFIGDLFAVRLISDVAVHHCLSILLAEMSASEHVHATHAVILRAKERLWQGPDSIRFVRDFTVSFSQRSSSIEENVSIVGDPFKKEVLQHLIVVVGITQKISEWHSRRPREPLDCGVRSVWKPLDPLW